MLDKDFKPPESDPDTCPSLNAAELVFVADCGGTKTAAWLVESFGPDTYRILADANTSAGNPLSAGFENAARAIEEALRLVRTRAQINSDILASRALLSIAGAANPEIAAKLTGWARGAKLARQVAIVSDVLPILAAGSQDCSGVALICGTGSSAFSRTPDGRTRLCGGWGYLLGDEGSGYAIGRAALQLTLRSFEEEKQGTGLADAVLRELGAKSATDVTRAVYSSSDARRRVAGIAKVVCGYANQKDEAACRILAGAAADLAQLVARTANSIGQANHRLTVAASGGVLTNSPFLQEQLLVELESFDGKYELQIVREPLIGCVRLLEPQFSNVLVPWTDIGQCRSA